MVNVDNIKPSVGTMALTNGLDSPLIKKNKTMII